MLEKDGAKQILEAQGYSEKFGVVIAKELGIGITSKAFYKYLFTKRDPWIQGHTNGQIAWNGLRTFPAFLLGKAACLTDSSIIHLEKITETPLFDFDFMPTLMERGYVDMPEIGRLPLCNKILFLSSERATLSYNVHRGPAGFGIDCRILSNLRTVGKGLFAAVIKHGVPVEKSLSVFSADKKGLKLVKSYRGFSGRVRDILPLGEVCVVVSYRIDVSGLRFYAFDQKGEREVAHCLYDDIRSVNRISEGMLNVLTMTDLITLKYFGDKAALIEVGRLRNVIIDIEPGDIDGVEKISTVLIKDGLQVFSDKKRIQIFKFNPEDQRMELKLSRDFEGGVSGARLANLGNGMFLREFVSVQVVGKGLSSDKEEKVIREVFCYSEEDNVLVRKARREYPDIHDPNGLVILGNNIFASFLRTTLGRRLDVLCICRFYLDRSVLEIEFEESFPSKVEMAKLFQTSEDVLGVVLEDKVVSYEISKRSIRDFQAKDSLWIPGVNYKSISRRFSGIL